MLTTFTGLVLQTYCNGGKEAKYVNTEGSEVADQRYDLKSINNSLESQVNSHVDTKMEETNTKLHSMGYSNIQEY
jgi:hypothetical protein